MKKRFLSLLLAIILLPSVAIFSACQDKSEYNLDNIATDYLDMNDDLTYINLEESGNGFINLTFDFSESESLNNSVVDNSTMYSKLNEFYIPIMEYSLSFINGYITRCADNDQVYNQNLKNSIKTNLDNLSTSMQTLDMSISELIKYTNYFSIQDLMCTEQLYRTFDCFESIYEYGIELSVEIADVYYNYILKNGNPDFNSYTIDTFSAVDAVSALKNRIDYLSMNLTRNFVEKNILDVDTSWAFRVGEATEIVNAFNNFKLNVANINRDISNYLGEAINLDNEKKAEFLSLSQQMHNIQSILDNDVKMYNSAYKSVRYSIAIKNLNRSEYENACINIINNHSAILDNYSVVMNEMINLILSVE